MQQNIIVVTFKTEFKLHFFHIVFKLEHDDDDDDDHEDKVYVDCVVRAPEAKPDCGLYTVISAVISCILLSIIIIMYILNHQHVYV